MIADTDVLIDMMQDNERTKQRISSIESQRIPLRLSSVSLFELYHGIERVKDSARRRRRIERVLESEPAYSGDNAVMKKAGRIDGRLAANGRAIGMGDTIIAATAVVHEEPILTRNVDHFDRIDDVEIESY